jgi:uncharacterized protein YcbK (DUF882 family)
LMSRRSLLKGALSVAGAWCLGGLPPAVKVAASVSPVTCPEKVLRLYHIHTDERLEVQYCREGIYDEDALNRLHHFLRCFYTNTVKPIDLKVIDLMCDIKDRIGVAGQISIVSGYRSPEYNEHLSRLGRHVVAGSMHLEGKAIDFAIPGCGTGELCRTAKLFAAGGVGKYPDFVHIDVGRVRYW